jgi:hypothetical protein
LSSAKKYRSRSPKKRHVRIAEAEEEHGHRAELSHPVHHLALRRYSQGVIKTERAFGPPVHNCGGLIVPTGK